MGGLRRWIALLATVVIALGMSAGASGTQDVIVSYNWSGYLEQGGPYNLSMATFNVPNLTAASGPTSADEWVGIDGSDPSDHSLIQAGIGERYDPATNRVHFEAWWEILPAVATLAPLPVGAGDRVGVAISRLTHGMWRIQLTNLTRHKQFTTTRRYNGPGRTADWVVEAASDPQLRVHTLGHYVPDVTFSSVRVDGRRGTLRPITMVQHGRIVSEVSKLGRTSFTVAYRG